MTLGEILSVCQTSEGIHGWKSVSRGTISKAVTSKWVNFNFWVKYLYKDKYQYSKNIPESYFQSSTVLTVVLRRLDGC